ncbi:MAG TPA: alginate export family protein, partial [Methylophilaceae bacterium]|nr:alginate export family protein [Methylophilaceae bacterium]
MFGVAQAEEVMPEYTFLDSVKAGKSMTSFRLRYEYVDQDAKAEKGNALTLRSLIGWQTAPFHNFSIGAQVIDVSKLENRYDDRALGDPEPGKGQHPIIADPDNTDINQLYVDWTGIRNTKFRVGRQQVNLDNVRFVGDIGFRQVMQVFDGVSVINKSIPDTEITVAHFDRVKQINTRLRSGDLDIVNAKYRISPSESVTAYGYFNNFDDLGFNAANGLGAGADASSKTLGLRLDGAHGFTPEWKGLYTAEYAKQDEYSGGDDRIDAHYYKLGGGAMYKSWFVRFDHETLSSNDGQYAFQTPFGTNHLFQGWADQFLVTPRQGIKDNFVTFGGKPIGDLTLLAEYHVFDADENFAKFGGGFGDQYGKE